jgi:hypothetical protein
MLPFTNTGDRMSKPTATALDQGIMESSSPEATIAMLVSTRAGASMTTGRGIPKEPLHSKNTARGGKIALMADCTNSPLNEGEGKGHTK